MTQIIQIFLEEGSSTLILKNISCIYDQSNSKQKLRKYEKTYKEC